MRPNLDINPETHFRVKAWAKKQGLDITEAYERLLQEGLSHVGDPGTDQDEGSP